MSKNELYYDENNQVLIGQQQKHYLDMDTGEEIYCEQITKRIFGSKKFWKCYLMDFLCVLGIVDSKQLDVFVYVCENTNQSTNLFIGSYDKIKKDLGCSKATVYRIMRKLQDYNFVKKVQNGVWFVNPNILMKGSDKKRQILLSYYENPEPIDQMTVSRVKRKEIERVQEEPQQMKIEDYGVKENEN